MFDFHMHSSVSFDSEGSSQKMAETAKTLGLREICFTDHWDHFSYPEGPHNFFSFDDYSKAYDNLKVDGLVIRKGIEFGLNEWNMPDFKEVLKNRSFDFVIGSVHYVDGYDPYYPEYWKVMPIKDAYGKYLEKTLECVKVHDGFDVLGHLTYVCKSANNPTNDPVAYADYRDISDEIMKILVDKGIGMEINTSGYIKTGDFLPSKEFLQRFKELGGEIVTIGSDAHNEERVGQFVNEGLELLKDVFGYVCTFSERKPIFHKL